MNFNCKLILRFDIDRLIFANFTLTVHPYELILASFKVDFHG